MTAAHEVFRQALADMYAAAAAGDTEALWLQGRYSRLKMQGWPPDSALRQAQHEAQVRSGNECGA